MKTAYQPKQYDSLSFLLNKVPEVTVAFWIIKVLSTTVGETAADFLAADLGFGLSGTSIVMSLLLVATLGIQFFSQTYTPWKYWLTVVLVSVVGTLITDNMVDNFGVTLEQATIGFSLALIATFFSWYLFEKTLSIRAIDTPRREAFYWLAILFTFALGTAAGDLTAEGLGLGYALSLGLFFGIIALVSVAQFVFKLNAILAFWLVYILTRPLGASLGDYLSQATTEGGLGLGATQTSFIFFAIIIGLVLLLSFKRK